MTDSSASQVHQTFENNLSIICCAMISNNKDNTKYVDAICVCYRCSILNSPTVASPSCLAVFLSKRYLRRHRCWGVWCNTHVAIGVLLIKLAIISHGIPVVCFESTTSLLRELMRVLVVVVFFFLGGGGGGSCVIKDALIKILGHFDWKCPQNAGFCVSGKTLNHSKLWHNFHALCFIIENKMESAF